MHFVQPLRLMLALLYDHTNLNSERRLINLKRFIMSCICSTITENDFFEILISDIIAELVFYDFRSFVYENHNLGLYETFRKHFDILKANPFWITFFVDFRCLLSIQFVKLIRLEP